MAERYLIDSNSIIDFCNGTLPEKGKNLLLSIKPEISIITNIELFASNNIPDNEQILLKKFVAFSNVFPIDKDLIDSTISIRLLYRIKLPDALIAATAIVNNLTLITRNNKDFTNIKGLKILNPYL
ncbi:MAG TPA: PIN domain nuclease [Flavobacterium sp.]|nr:PIN domain nuclease [Flavobacterium sp.]